jgi:hypothetical protein
MALQVRATRQVKTLDFSRDDLTKFSNPVLTLVLEAHLGVKLTKPEVYPFFQLCDENRKAKGVVLPKTKLNAYEKTYIIDYMTEESTKVVSMSAVMDTLLEKKDISITKDGISWDENLAKRRQIQPALPEHDIGKMGGQLLAGAIIAALPRDSKGVKKSDTTVLKRYIHPLVTQNSMMQFQSKIIGDMQEYFKGRTMKGPGRDYMHEVVMYLKDRPLVEYFAFQNSLVSTLFRPCFEWQKLSKLESYPKSVKKDYEACFELLTDDIEGVLEYKKASRQKMVWIWKAPLPGKADVEVLSMTSFASICTHLSDSRAFRGTDDSGLSAWSAGFLSVGGYTKFQHAVSRKLSIILGAKSLEDTRGGIFVYDSNEPQRKEVIRILIARKVDGIKFVVSRAEKLRDVASVGYLVTGASNPKGPTVDIHFLETSLLTAKKTEWAKVDAAQAEIRHAYFPPDLKKRVIITSHVNSTGWWSSVPKLYISAVTSIHNLYPVVSNYPITLALAEELGGKLKYEVAPDLSQDDYKERVISHNKARNLFYLFPTYSFSPRMNMLMPKEKEKLTFSKLADLEDDLSIDEEEGEWPEEEGSDDGDDEEDGEAGSGEDDSEGDQYPEEDLNEEGDDPLEEEDEEDRTEREFAQRQEDAEERAKGNSSASPIGEKGKFKGGGKQQVPPPKKAEAPPSKVNGKGSKVPVPPPALAKPLKPFASEEKI